MMRLPKIVEINNDNMIATAALKVINPKSDAPGNWNCCSRYSNR
ncbi:hypothetical protein ADIWIN_0174 [Winogradskyella psychrotolerans RS-3]|uniref:Uncharacterized protein n=1 Tax=Winogradskyella psychrotolerans RS-3 TaxID=641526 RepID=S7VWZ8_9FLAO|nr:hypothetical protein ADIWIN_0174 [Winogradskyella psychrotolerans RS-3]